MADQKTAAEHAQERTQALHEQYTNEFDESQQAAIDARGDQPDTAETEEEYAERVRLAASSGIFGNAETTYGVQAAGANPAVHDPVAGTRAVAAADADAEAGGESVDPETAFAQADPRVPADTWGGGSDTEPVEVAGQTAPATAAGQAFTPDLDEEEQQEAENLAQPADEPDPDAPHGETVSEENAPEADTEQNAADGSAAGEEQA
jgi:hypothetical protein